VSFRVRVTLFCACALAVALGAAGVVAYASQRDALGRELDALIQARAAQVTPAVVQDVLAANNLLPKQLGRGRGHAPARKGGTLPEAAPRRAAVGDVSLGDLELVTSGGGRAVASPSPVAAAVPVDRAARAIAAGARPSVFRTVVVAGVPLRVYVFRAAPGVAGEVAAPLTQVDASLGELRMRLAGIAFGALLLVVLLAVVVARQALRPVAALTGATERVVRTGDLRQRVRVGGRGRDEVGRLAASVNAMLTALERSVGAQRQLVADASHELRTPLTSLSANLQLLDEPGGLEAGDARELVAQARGQAEELAALVSALVELAHGSEVELHLDAIRLDLVAAAAAERLRRHMPQVGIREHLSPCSVWGDADMLERAVGNLLDNAVKWSPSGGYVDLTVSAGEVVVSDDGPGIADADLPFVFDRFYRSPAARGRPGSGLGLAIVRQVAELHGGAASAANSGAGAVLRLRLPALGTPPPGNGGAPGASDPARGVSGAWSPGAESDQRRQAIGDRPDIA
jgi:two-component system sensor histidine kinase MprB